MVTVNRADEMKARKSCPQNNFYEISGSIVNKQKIHPTKINQDKPWYTKIRPPGHGLNLLVLVQCCAVLHNNEQCRNYTNWCALFCSALHQLGSMAREAVLLWEASVFGFYPSYKCFGVIVVLVEGLPRVYNRMCCVIQWNIVVVMLGRDV